MIQILKMLYSKLRKLKHCGEYGDDYEYISNILIKFIEDVAS